MTDEFRKKVTEKVAKLEFHLKYITRSLEKMIMAWE